MKFIPFEKYSLTTPLSIPEARERLAANLEPVPKSTWRNPKTTMPYYGTLNNDGFEIQRIINYRNSFQPTIHGRFSNAMGATTIEIRMRPPVITVVFMIIWFTPVTLVCLGVLISSISSLIRDPRSFQPITLLVFLLWAFGYGLTMFGFKTESARAKTFLTHTFKADQVSTSPSPP